jgi:hypothetical protein
MLIANRKKQEELEARIELLEAKQAGLTDDEIRLLMAKRAIKRLQGRRELRIHALFGGDPVIRVIHRSQQTTLPVDQPDQRINRYYHAGP